jgi:hypothetical protein
VFLCFDSLGRGPGAARGNYTEFAA